MHWDSVIEFLMFIYVLEDWVIMTDAKRENIMLINISKYQLEYKWKKLYSIKTTTTKTPVRSPQQPFKKKKSNAEWG